MQVELASEWASSSGMSNGTCGTDNTAPVPGIIWCMCKRLGSVGEIIGTVACGNSSVFFLGIIEGSSLFFLYGDRFPLSGEMIAGVSYLWTMNSLNRRSYSKQHHALLKKVVWAAFSAAMIAAASATVDDPKSITMPVEIKG